MKNLSFSVKIFNKVKVKNSRVALVTFHNILTSDFEWLHYNERVKLKNL